MTEAPITHAKEPVQEKRAADRHRTDSLTILMFLTLLLLTVLTIWLFKHRRFRFVHETGLAMIYGLIVGAIIRYTTQNSKIPSAVIVNETYYFENAPESVLISYDVQNNSSSKRIQYDYYGEVSVPEDESTLPRTVTFNPELFFNVLLPLIIFNAGYSMKRKHFFRNIGAIFAYAFLGTTISCVVVGGIMFGLTRLMTNISVSLNDCFFFGALISATDPVTVLAIFHDLNVDVDLYALVFGESVLNDAVAIVLSWAIETYGRESRAGHFSASAFFHALLTFVKVFFGAFAIGSLMGCITALLTKFTKIRDHPLLETSLFVLMSYITFEASEAAKMSGIVAVLFCGITQAHYTFNNLSATSKVWTKQLFDLLNFLAENFVFLYIGVSIFTFQPQKWHLAFIVSAFFAIILGRIFNIYPLSFLLNLGRTNKIRFNFQHMMMFAGLRGAIAYALAIQSVTTEPRQLMLSSTMCIVLVTVILCGGLSTPMLQWLQIRTHISEGPHIGKGSTLVKGPHIIEGPTLVKGSTSGRPEAPPPSSSSKYEKAWVAAKWYNFDTRFMKPLLTNCRPCLIETLPNCCLPVAQFLTTEEQLAQGSSRTEDNDSDTDMIIAHGDRLSYGEPSSGASSASVLESTDVVKSAEGLDDEEVLGDLGLGDSNHQPMKLQIQLPGSSGDRV
ncbi:sodium/hydrogen exchanger 6-like [Liolophura sinensis]|uniref:sodium/hydrogen exchanger 6-like n=1 Tax=Liolophura sinensis TaxID=3198878 RepID=UPI0031581CCC